MLGGCGLLGHRRLCRSGAAERCGGLGLGFGLGLGGGVGLVRPTPGVAILVLITGAGRRGTARTVAGGCPIAGRVVTRLITAWRLRRGGRLSPSAAPARRGGGALLAGGPAPRTRCAAWLLHLGLLCDGLDAVATDDDGRAQPVVEGLPRGIEGDPQEAEQHGQDGHRACEKAGDAQPVARQVAPDASDLHARDALADRCALPRRQDGVVEEVADQREQAHGGVGAVRDQPRVAVLADRRDQHQPEHRQDREREQQVDQGRGQALPEAGVGAIAPGDALSNLHLASQVDRRSQPRERDAPAPTPQGGGMPPWRGLLDGGNPLDAGAARA